MTNTTKQLNAQVFPYLLDCICSDGYDVVTSSDAEKVAFLRDTFYAEAGWNIDRIGTQNALMEWCQGLPSSFNIEFANYHIILLAKKWGSIPQDATEKQEQKILDNYWQFIASKTLQLFKKYGV